MFWWGIVYLVVGVISGAFVAWEIAKEEAQKREPSPLAVVMMFFVGAVLWPVIGIGIALVSIGTVIIGMAKTKGKARSHER